MNYAAYIGEFTIKEPLGGNVLMQDTRAASQGRLFCCTTKNFTNEYFK